MPTTLLLEITETLGPRTVWSFVEVTVSGISHTHARQTYPLKVPTRYQNHRHNYIPHDISQYLQPSYIPNQHSHRAPYKTNDKRHDTMGYPCTQDAIYTNPSRKPLFLSADQTEKSIKLEGLVSQVSTRIIVT